MAELRRIVLVEDSQYDAELIVAALAETGFANDVEIVRDGAALESLLQLERSKLSADGGPAAVLLDLRLPESDIFQVLAQIKNDRMLRSLPLVMLASSREEQELARSYGSEIGAFVDKPVDFREFVKSIRQVGVLLGLIEQQPSPDLI